MKDMNMGIPAWAADQIFVRTQVTLSWRDRLKLLINRGTLFVITETNCESSPGHVETTSTAYTPPLWKKRDKGGEGPRFVPISDILNQPPPIHPPRPRYPARDDIPYEREEDDLSNT